MLLVDEVSGFVDGLLEFVLTVEWPNVTLYFKVKMTFLNPKFNQIRPEIAYFWALFGL